MTALGTKYAKYMKNSYEGDGFLSGLVHIPPRNKCGGWLYPKKELQTISFALISISCGFKMESEIENKYPKLNLKNTLKNNQKLSICFFIRISSIKTKLISVVDEKINWTPPNSILFKVLSIILQLDFYLSLLSCYFCSMKFLSLQHIFPFFFLSL